MDTNKKLEQLEQRIEQLELELRELKRSQTAQPLLTKSIPSQRSEPYTKVPIQEQAPVDWEHIIAKVWLPRIFMFVLLIGVVWGFKAAIDGGILTEGMRCIIGYLAGGILVFLGFKQHKEQRPLLSQTLLGGSIGIFMLTTFAAHYLYDFIHAFAALGLNLLWVIMGIWFSRKFHSEVLSILSCCAGILTPFLVQSSEPFTLFFVIYEVLLYVGFMMIAMRAKLVKLFYTSFALLHLSFLFFTLIVGRDEDIVTYGVLVQHIALAAAVVLNRTLIKHQSLTLIMSFVLTTVWFRICFESMTFEIVMLIFLLCYSLISGLLWRKDKERLPFSLTIVSYAVLFYLFSIIESETLPSILLIEGCIALLLGYVIKSKLQKINALIIYSLGGLTAIHLLSGGMDQVISINSLTWLVIIATLYGVNKLIERYRTDGKMQDVIMTIYIALSAIVLLFITDFTQAATKGLSDNAQHLWVSLVWACYSIVVIVFGALQDIKKVRLVGLLLLFITLIKVIFFDLPFVSIIIRAVLFIGLGGIGIVMSRFFYSNKK